MKGMSNNMYNPYISYPCPYFMNGFCYDQDNMYNPYESYPCYDGTPMYNLYRNEPYMNDMNDMDDMDDADLIELRDYGPEPFVINIEEATKRNNNFRTALWTGEHLQLTLMSIPVGGEIGLEIHPNLDQFIRIEEGEGTVKMGNNKYSLDFQKQVYDNYVFIVPAGKWHNLINTGNKPIKLYSIYAPPKHPYGTVHVTKAEADAAE